MRLPADDWRTLRFSPTQTHQIKKRVPMGPFFLFGAPGRIRTSDPLVRSQVLYPAELRAHVSYSNLTIIRFCSFRSPGSCPEGWTHKRSFVCSPLRGALRASKLAARVCRTSDPLVRSQVLYPAELRAHVSYSNLTIIRFCSFRSPGSCPEGWTHKRSFVCSPLRGALRASKLAARVCRTSDPLVRSQVLYQAPLRAHVSYSNLTSIRASARR